MIQIKKQILIALQIKGLGLRENRLFSCFSQMHTYT